ncbi:MAG: 3'-5' exonuclease [Candidatus Paceibacterota bacterium]
MIVLDIEASGVEYHKHSIVSIGAFDFNEPTNRFYEECRIWDGAHIMEDALIVNGFTEAEITDPSKKTEGEVITLFLKWAEKINDRTLCGQNVSFDRDFTKAAAERAGINWILAYRTIDTHTLAYMHHVNAGKNIPFTKNHSALNLDAILNYVGIPEEPQPHNALTGALCHGEVASRLLYNKKLLPEFEQFDIPWTR